MGIDPHTFAKKLEDFFILQYFGPEDSYTKKDQKHKTILKREHLPPRDEGMRHLRKLLQDATRMYLEYSKHRDWYEKQWNERKNSNVSGQTTSTKMAEKETQITKK